MQDSIEMTGMVLSSMPIGEYDKRLVILTQEEGAITAFARGARRPKSTLRAAANSFVTGRFSLVPGRSAYSLVGANVQHYFTELAEEMPGVYYGFYFLEFASYYGHEGIDATEMLNLLYFSLRALQNEALDDRVIRCAYEIRLMVLNGEYAPPEVPPEGASPTPERATPAPEGAGVWTESPPTNKMSASAAYAAQYASTAPFQKLFSFNLEETALRELERHVKKHIARVVDRRMRSLEILEQFTAAKG